MNASRRLVVGLKVVVYVHVVERAEPPTSSKGAWHYMYLYRDLSQSYFEEGIPPP